MSNQSIYNMLRTAGMTKEGACAMLGNMAAEAGMRSGNAQDVYGVVDEDYTAATDAGANSFVTDSIGYGLCQWTLASRKQKLLNYARMQGVSIADESMQVNFCIKELRDDFPDIWQTLTTSHDLLQCTQLVLKVYENPEIKNLGTRMDYAKQAEAYFDSNLPAQDACPIDGPCDQEKEPEVSGAFALLAEYMQTEEFQRGYVAFVAGKVGAK